MNEKEENNVKTLRVKCPDCGIEIDTGIRADIEPPSDMFDHWAFCKTCNDLVRWKKMKVSK